MACNLGLGVDSLGRLAYAVARPFLAFAGVRGLFANGNFEGQTRVIRDGVSAEFTAEYSPAIRRSSSRHDDIAILGAPWQQSSEARQAAAADRRAQARERGRRPNGAAAERGRRTDRRRATSRGPSSSSSSPRSNAARDGDFRLRLPGPRQGHRRRAQPRLQRARRAARGASARRSRRVGRVIGREGRLTERAAPAGARGALARDGRRRSTR